MGRSFVRKPEASVKMVSHRRIQEGNAIVLGGPCQGDVADFHPNTNWHVLGQNQDGWRQLCLDVLSMRP